MCFVVASSLLILSHASGGDAGECVSCETSPRNGLGTYCEEPCPEPSLAGLQEGELNIIHTLASLPNQCTYIGLNSVSGSLLGRAAPNYSPPPAGWTWSLGCSLRGKLAHFENPKIRLTHSKEEKEVKH